jgi:UDP-N-acetylmuramoyl-tripeptide--D-alanyl-D-alanine ligase
MQFTIQDVQRIVKGSLINPGLTSTSLKRQIRSISIDSRQLKRGDLFIAIRGDRFDGHTFVNQVIRKGAGALIVSRSFPLKNAKIPVIRVKDTIQALGFMARAHRLKFDAPVIAITGSAGKTTTKEMTAAILKCRYKVLYNVKTQNNHIGVPLTLFRLNNSHQVVVLEFGTNQKGDIAWLTKIARPNVGMITNIGEVHLEKLKSPHGVLKEKTTLFRGLPSRGPAIVNQDDGYLKTWLRTNRNKSITFGIHSEADFQATDISSQNAKDIFFKVNGSRKIQLRTIGQHNIYNAIAAISCGRLFKISYNNIHNCLNKFRFPEGRLTTRRLRGCWIIDDTYNANPLSFAGAIEALNDLKIPGQKILVCADMLELGRSVKDLHQRVGELAARAGIDVLLTLGHWAKLTSQTFQHVQKRATGIHCRTIQELRNQLKIYARPGNAILIKGSRRMAMERAVRFLESHLS